GDLIYLDLVTPEVDRSTVYDRVRDGAGFLPAYVQETWQNDPFAASTVERRLHTDTTVTNGGRSYLRLSTASHVSTRVRQTLFGEPGPYYATLEPGRPYRLSLWLRNPNPGTNTVRVYTDPPYQTTIDTTFPATSEWTLHTFDFLGPAYPYGWSPIQLFIGFDGPGAIDLDNVLLYETSPGREPFDFMPEMRDEFLRFRPGCIRIWSGQSNIGGGITLDDWLESDSLNDMMWDVNQGPVRGPGMHLPRALELVDEVDSIPWLIVSTLLDEAEWSGLMEYLAAPYDEAMGDSVTNKPWAWRRVQHRGGNTTPWTDAFETIRLEFGNETWASDHFVPQGFPGLENPPLAGAAHMGLFAEYFFNIAQSSPYWTSNIEFIVNGWWASPWPNGFGATAVENAPSADFVDITAYAGGWEQNLQLGGGEFTDQSFWDVLLFGPRFYQPWAQNHVNTVNALRAGGRDIRLAVYEGGPGYDEPMPSQPYNPDVEVFGKSLAAGVMTLDNFLFNAQRGFGPQAFFHFGEGFNWTTHGFLANGFT
ncbi:MAG: hypothetical protein AAF492_19560, partial [Verrucomicrobiota bacterium]